MVFSVLATARADVGRGREFYLQLNDQPLREARELLEFYEKFWKQRFSNLETLLNDEKSIKNTSGE